MEKSNHEIFDWIDEILIENQISDFGAYNFNIYESEGEFHIQVVGTNSFDLDDDDWACDEIYSSEEDIFIIPFEESGSDWKDGLLYIKGLLNNYLEFGQYSRILKKSRGVGVGFVDGDIDILYKS